MDTSREVRHAGLVAGFGAVCLAGLALCATPVAAAAQATAEVLESKPTHPSDARVGLTAGWTNAGMAARGMELVSNVPRPPGFFNPANAGDFRFANTDLAFSGSNVFVGGYYGFQVWDISEPTRPSLRIAFTCPGGQGDVSVHGNLLFMSVEETSGRVDCGTQGVRDTVSAERFRGVRIFDISRIDTPRQVAAVQTCRGSHTHTLVPDPNDPGVMYVYVSGTGIARPHAELAGCSGAVPTADSASSYFRIEIIRVPLSSPQDARIVNAPRIFADRESGAIGGLWPGGTHGPGTQATSETNRCHDITAYPEFGVAAGACSGNGIILDIRDPANPVRIDEVIDPNFAFWHSATFSNDARKVIFTDEWGGGSAARCRATDRPEWGANALFERDGGKLRHAGYYKLPAPQTDAENCVAHNGSLIPVPGRDIMVQGWYQGGISVFDFTDPVNPVEIAFFDRGPVTVPNLTMGGHWSAYWYNGRVYGAEIARGLDVLRLVPSEHLSENEIRAAELVRVDAFNPQLQKRASWPASFVVARAYVDQLRRNPQVRPDWTRGIARELDQAERLRPAQRPAALTRLASRLEREVPASGDGEKTAALAGAVRALAASQR
ncbi:MAG TPA: hypothetical protein VMM17_00130 [Gemmatimonadaceae bacterium]|nr:hypothetical protein [Gemmatimonadaceae bacterium]